MRDRGNHYPFSGANLKHLRHERHVVILLEPFCHRLAQNRWSKRTERFTPLDLRVQNLFHVRPPRISQDGTIAESARPPFHPALKPAHDLSVGNRLRRLAQQILLRQKGKRATRLHNFLVFPIKQQLNFPLGRFRTEVRREIRKSKVQRRSCFQVSPLTRSLPLARPLGPPVYVVTPPVTPF